MSQDGKAGPQKNQASHMALSIVLVVTAMTWAAFLARDNFIPWSTLIFIAGTVGGVVNNFRRLQKLSLLGAREYTPMADRLVTIQIYISPFVGGVFATVLTGIFMAGLVQGSLFPAFEWKVTEFTTYRDFAALCNPATNADMAKTIVWSFIAGFSEGLVPNFISKLTSDAGQSEDGKQRGASKSTGD